MAVGVLAYALAAALLRLLAQVTVAVSAPASIAPGEPALVRVEVTAPAAATVRLTPPDVAPFTVASAARVPATGAALVGGAPGFRRQEWRYVLGQPAGARGRYTFEPFAAEAGGPGLRTTVARSRAWGLDVRPPARPGAAFGGGTFGGGALGGSALGGGASGSAAPGPGGPRAPAAAQLPAGPPAAGRGTGVTFTARVWPERVYVGEQATYELAVTVDAAARGRIRRNPEFVPPELRGVLAVELPATHASTPERDVHVYRRAIFPLAPGPVRVPGAQLSYALATGASYFSREERLSVRSNAVLVEAVAPPAAGRPRGWQGAVGTFRASTRTGAPAVRAGDALEYTVRLEGEGNVSLLPRPALALAWADLVEAGERVTVDSTAARVRGAKEFVWLLTPRTAGTQVLPGLSYAYFDPAARGYDTASAAPFAVIVQPGVAAGADAGVTAGGPARRDALPIRTRWRGAARRPLPSRPAFWLLVALAPAPAALVLVARRAGARQRAARARAATTLQAITRRGDPRPADVRRAVEREFVRRVGFGPGEFGAPAAFALALRRVGVTAATAARAAAFAEDLDAATFGTPDSTAPASSGGELARAAAAVLRAVDAEAQDRWSLASVRPTPGSTARVWLFVAFSASLGGAAACAASRPERPADAGAAEFGRGVAAYQGGDPVAARRAFLDAAARSPAAPDAWANAGTAAWQAADTLGAALGWQRAIRLEPHADDVRARLALLPAAQDGWTAAVPPVAPDWIAVPALALAVVAGAAALASARRPGTARWSTGWLWTWGAALVGGLAAAGVHAAADPAHLALVAGPGPLRAEPAMDADPGPRVDLTDVARVRQRQGVWARVTLDGEREGWIDAGRLVALAPGAGDLAAEPAGGER